MNEYVLYHRHASSDCAASFAAWNGIDSQLRRTQARSTCAFGAHEIWWVVPAATENEALDQLPSYVAQRTIAIRVTTVDMP